MRAEREISPSVGAPRILQFVNSLHLGGTEGQVVELVRGLRRGFRVGVAVVSAKGAHLSTLRGMGIEPFETPLAGSVLRPNTVRQVARLAGRIRKERIALVHAQDFYTALLAVPAARLAGAKVIVSRLDLGHWHGRGQSLALAAATREADHVVANAQAIKRQLLLLERVAPEHVTVIRNGIDLVRFDQARSRAPAPPLPSFEGRVVVVHVANMTHPVKAQEDLFEALRILRGRHPEALTLLVGDGMRRDALERLAGQMGLSESVRFLGHREDVPALLARCQVGVLPSHAEGLSNAIIEGMAAGLPMVVTDAGGNAELVRDGRSGFVVPIKAPERLAVRLATLVGSEVLRRRMGAAGRAFVEQELTVERMVSEHEALYRELLAAR